MNETSSEIQFTAEKVVRLAKIFDKIGGVLNLVNKSVAISIPILTALFMSASGIDPGILYFILSIPVAGITYILGWIQIASLRLLASYFQLKGLQALRELKYEK